MYSLISYRLERRKRSCIKEEGSVEGSLEGAPRTLTVENTVRSGRSHERKRKATRRKVKEFCLGRRGKKGNGFGSHVDPSHTRFFVEFSTTSLCSNYQTSISEKRSPRLDDHDHGSARSDSERVAMEYSISVLATLYPHLYALSRLLSPSIISPSFLSALRSRIAIRTVGYYRDHRGGN